MFRTKCTTILTHLLHHFLPCLYKIGKNSAAACPAALLLIQPLTLSSAAEQSASWQHWNQMHYNLDPSYIICYSSRRSGLVHATCPVVPKSMAKQVWNSYTSHIMFLHYLSWQGLLSGSREFLVLNPSPRSGFVTFTLCS